MKFVHLTPVHRVPSIFASGISKGDGRRGRGVYAVPLVMLRYPNPMSKFGGCPPSAERVLPAARSSSQLWRWWIRSDKRAEIAAISFTAPAGIWPADLYLRAPRGMHRSVVASARELGLRYKRAPNRHQGLKQTKQEMHIEVPDARTCGKVLKPYLDRVLELDDWEILTAIEIVFRAPVPARCIANFVVRGKASTGKQILRRDNRRRSDG